MDTESNPVYGYRLRFGQLYMLRFGQLYRLPCMSGPQCLSQTHFNAGTLENPGAA